MTLDEEKFKDEKVKLPELKKYLESLFGERCGIQVFVEFNMVEANLDKYSKQNEIMTKNEIKEIHTCFRKEMEGCIFRKKESDGWSINHRLKKINLQEVRNPL